MSDFFKNRLGAQDGKLERSLIVFNKEIDLLFTPYSTRQLHSRSILHPFYHTGDLLGSIVAACVDAYVFFIEVFSDPAPTPYHALPLFLTLIATAVMDVINAALSTLSFVTRTLATLQLGYNGTSSIEECELEHNTTGGHALR